MSIQTRTTALQNEIVRLYMTFEFNGTLANPANQPLVEIIDADGVTILDTLHAQSETTGICYVDWYVPANFPLGNYYDRWTWQWLPTSSVTDSTHMFTVHSLENYINFISPSINHQVTPRVVQMMLDLANWFIYEAQHIPVYWEQGLRIQQDNQQKRIKTYYYLTLDVDKYVVGKDAVYFNNGQKFTVFQDLSPMCSSSSSSTSESSSESIGNYSSSSSSSTSGNSNSSSSSSLSLSSSSSSSSSSSESVGNNSSSSSSVLYPTTTTTTTAWVYQPILTVVGTGNPSSSGTLNWVSGTGPTAINFISWQAKESRFSTIYNFAYQNWNQDPKPMLRLNNRLIDDGWFVDYNGYVYLDGLMSPEDSVNMRYNFAYFSEEEILGFLRFALQMMNSMPPASTTYGSLETMPGEWSAPVLLYAGITALRRLIFGLNWQEKFIIFSRPDNLAAANDAIQNFKDLLSQYIELWTEMAANAKTKRLPAIAQFIMPEYTLPGGRCCAATTYAYCKVDGKKKKATIEELFDLFTSGSDIEVLSMANNNKIIYTPISKVWESGKKTTYYLKTKNAQIRLTKEHLVYMPETNTYKPVQDIHSGDVILVLKGKKLVEQKLIADPQEYKIEQVYDIEVPETENFIGDNIVSHNSRFFRYLYKSTSGA